MAKKTTKGKTKSTGKGKAKKAELLPQIKKDASVFLSSEEGKVTKENVVKTAMSLMKMCDVEMRLPLCEMLPENKEKLVKAMKEYKLI